MDSSLPTFHCTVPLQCTIYHTQPTLPLTVLYVTYSLAMPHSVDGLSLHSCYVVPSCQHCVDGIPAVEALHVSNRHVDTVQVTIYPTNLNNII